jgi:flagellar biosynthesis/type III secretory pathway chaperone
MSTLTNLLEQQISELQVLHQVVQEIRTALLNRDLEKVGQLSQKEEQLLMNIQQYDGNIALHPDHSKLKEPPWDAQVNTAQTLLEQCRLINQANRDHVEINLASMNRLHQLLVTNRHQDSLTYTDKGQPHTSASSGQSIEV